VADPIEADESVVGGPSRLDDLEFPTVETWPSRIRTWRFPYAAVAVPTMRAELRRFLTEFGLTDPTVDDLILAACEAAANCVEHARHPTEPFFDVQAGVLGREARIVIRDHGRWTTRHVDPGHQGRGLHMMTMLAAVSLTSGPEGTTVTLRNLVDGPSDDRF
jgi:anti-sigma regulatory factor (Ser/Thr protein kinase)